MARFWPVRVCAMARSGCLNTLTPGARSSARSRSSCWIRVRRRTMCSGISGHASIRCFCLGRSMSLIHRAERRSASCRRRTFASSMTAVAAGTQPTRQSSRIRIVSGTRDVSWNSARAIARSRTRLLEWLKASLIERLSLPLNVDEIADDTPIFGEILRLGRPDPAGEFRIGAGSG